MLKLSCLVARLALPVAVNVVVTFPGCQTPVPASVNEAPHGGVPQLKAVKPPDVKEVAVNLSATAPETWKLRPP
jgi:hypothetical protein